MPLAPHSRGQPTRRQRETTRAFGWDRPGLGSVRRQLDPRRLVAPMSGGTGKRTQTIRQRNPMTTVTELQRALSRLLWSRDPSRLQPWQARLLALGRVLQAVLRDLVRGDLNVQASSLAFTTLLSLVPLLAVSFSVLKGFGVHNQIEPLLLEAMAPLGKSGKEITAALITFVDNTNVRVLGSLGLGMLLYSVIALISKIEATFNHIWHVHKPRPYSQRFSHYLSVLTVGPLLFFSAVGATASLADIEFVQQIIRIEPLGFMLNTARRLIPYLLITLAFAFAYMYVPNTRVRLLPALTGAMTAGLLWQSSGFVFANFIATSTQHAAIYSSLAIPILFMIWVNIGWMILILGAHIAFYTQEPAYQATGAREIRLSNRLRERLLLGLAAEIATRHYSDSPPATAAALAATIGAPPGLVQNLLKQLEDADWVVRSAGEPSRFVPARSPDELSVAALLDAIRADTEADWQSPPPPYHPVMRDLEAHLEQARTSALGALTLADLARQITAADNPTAEMATTPVD